MFELAFSLVALTKPKSRNEFDFFRIMTIMHKIGCGSYELKNIFLKYRETIRISRRHKIGCGSYELKNVFLKCRETLRISRRKERVSEKSMVYFKNKNDVYSLCSIRRVSNKI